MPKNLRVRRPVLGARVQFTAVLTKVRTSSDDGMNSRVEWTTLPQVGAGIYIGARTVYEGRYSPGSYRPFNDDEPHLAVTKGVYHALVVEAERRAPVRVPFAALIEPNGSGGGEADPEDVISSVLHVVRYGEVAPAVSDAELIGIAAWVVRAVRAGGLGLLTPIQATNLREFFRQIIK